MRLQERVAFAACDAASAIRAASPSPQFAAQAEAAKALIAGLRSPEMTATYKIKGFDPS